MGATYCVKFHTKLIKSLMNYDILELGHLKSWRDMPLRAVPLKHGQLP